MKHYDRIFIDDLKDSAAGDEEIIRFIELFVFADIIQAQELRR